MRCALLLALLALTPSLAEGVGALATGDATLAEGVARIRAGDATSGAGGQDRIGPAWQDKRNPIVATFGGKRLDLWSLRPLRKAAPPKAPKGTNPIDAFLGTSNAPLADKRTLARRLSFDITGLPPTAEELARFTTTAAYADRLLSDRRYGEHVARLWLDVVRYSDSNGFDWDEFRPLAWRYRDYVVRSFNADKPYDRFLTEQLAGDELVAGQPHNAAEQDALIATSFLRLGPWDNSAGLFGEANRVRNALMNDLVETTSATFLGLTYSCARCHDHKTDPIAQTDFYRLRAFFENVTFRDDLALDLAPEQERLTRLKDAREQELKAAKEARKAATTKDKAQLQVLDARVASAEREAALPTLTYGLVSTDSDKAPQATHLLAAGELTQPKEEVICGFPSVLDPNPVTLLKPLREKSTGRRLTLAKWLTNRQNPLTARVMVNRVWQQYFGEGLVATPNDFGYAGAKPNHPELLDWLAQTFMDEGWSLKKLQKRIVTSRAYQRAQSRPPRRLTAEQLRDSILAVSGTLRERHGGPPIWPELPAEVLQANPAFLDDNKEKTKGWYPSPAERQPVRSLYLVQKRTVAVPLLSTFDLPDNAISCARRTTSTVAPQALTLLNNPFLVEAARAFAKRVEAASTSPERQVNIAFSLALQRAPDTQEQALCYQLLMKHGLSALCRALLNLNEFAYIE